jgi:Na+-transporting NADH:ubiquinone oxidoreductase subunit C
MQSNRYIIVYSIVMVVLVAVALTFVAVQLKPAQEENIRIEKMQNILKAVNIASTPKNAGELYEKYITETIVVNSEGKTVEGTDAFGIDIGLENKKAVSERMLPIYVCTQENGEKNFIVPMRGKGLWGPIWGYVAFKNDFNTIVGCMFDHKGETPGLGAEINQDFFQVQFKNKVIFNEQSEFISVRTIKGGAAENDPHGVDAISGGTITSDGLSNMMKDGLAPYVNYFKMQNTQE